MNNTGIVNNGSLYITKESTDSEKDLKDLLTSFKNLFDWFEKSLTDISTDINDTSVIGYKIPVFLIFNDKQFVISADINNRTREVSISAGWYVSDEDFIDNNISLLEARIINQNMDEIEYLVHNQINSIKKGSFFEKPETMRTICRKAENVRISEEIEIYKNNNYIHVQDRTKQKSIR